MKKVICLFLTLLAVLSLCACEDTNNDYKSNSSGSSYSSSNSNDYDYDKGYGYTAPKEGQSFSDYVKEQDPDLYESITDNYNSATGSSSYSSSGDDYDYDKGYGYTAPKEGQSFSDYVKEQDPDLYASLFG